MFMHSGLYVKQRAQEFGIDEWWDKDARYFNDKMDGGT